MPQAGLAACISPFTLRKELGLFVNLRPIKNYPNVPSRYDKVDLVIFRENSEDLYAGNERMIDEGTAEGIKPC